MALTTASLKHAIDSISRTLKTEHSALSELDGKLGDGDLGITLQKAFKALLEARDGIQADDVGATFTRSAGIVAKVSSSSFGTLMATAFIAAGKQAKGREALKWSEVAGLIEAARDAVMARGKARLGNKTIVDALDAAAIAAAGHDDPDALRSTVAARVDETIAEFRDKPAEIGRARIFAERSVGLDDPGMVAFRTMIAALGEH